MNEKTVTIPTVRTLRRRWKPHKERLHATGGDQPTSIRFHRACSWIARVEKNNNGEDHDVDLISLWISFNSLYGQWDEEKREPKPDRESWRAFVDSALRLDESGYVAEALTEHKRLVMSLLEDEYLSSFFWQEPCAKRAGQFFFRTSNVSVVSRGNPPKSTASIHNKSKTPLELVASRPG